MSQQPPKKRYEIKVNGRSQSSGDDYLTAIHTAHGLARRNQSAHVEIVETTIGQRLREWIGGGKR